MGGYLCDTILIIVFMEKKRNRAEIDMRTLQLFLLDTLAAR